MALGLLSALSRHLSDNLADSFFSDTGPFARKHYPKHIEAIELTRDNDVVSVFGGNRSGKTNLLAYILSCWAQGTYPDWWNGRVFLKPTRLWACSQTSALVTAGLQRYLIGPDGGGGLIKSENILHVDWAPNTLGMAQRVLVKHVPTGLGSEILFKTYDMGWRRFQSDTIDGAALDEEPPAMIYSEALTRSATTNGCTLLGFTALQGVTPLVAHLLPQYAGVTEETEDEEEPAKRAHVFIGWEDIPYAQLSKAKRESLASKYLPHERDARMKGIPQMGTGLVYPVPEGNFIVDVEDCMRAWKGPTPPKHWPRIAAADPGGTPRGDGRTAAVWYAYDSDSDCIWAYSEYYEKFAPIPSHVHAWAKRGKWIPFVIDPAGANVIDGKGVYAEYVSEMHELDKDWPVLKADKRFSLGRANLYDRMMSGRFKVISTLRNMLAEHRSYVIKENGSFAGACHSWDCNRYAVQSIGHARLAPQYQRPTAALPEKRYFR